MRDTEGEIEGKSPGLRKEHRFEELEENANVRGPEEEEGG